MPALPDASFFNLTGDFASAYNALVAAFNAHTHTFRVADLADVQIIGLQHGDVLSYDAASATWRVSAQQTTVTRDYVDAAISGHLSKLTVE